MDDQSAYADKPYNPHSPDKGDLVLCWGENCEGQFSTAHPPARVSKVPAIDCACYRKQMKWLQ